MSDSFYDQVATKLRADCPLLLQVETGLAAEAALDMLALGADMTALVHPLSDAAGAIRDAGMFVSQAESEQFGVTLAMVFPGGFSQFEPARLQVKAALRGWATPDLSMPIAYAGGNLLDYQLAKDGGRFLWLLRFNAPRQASYEHQS